MIIILIIMQEAIDNESVRNCFGISSEKAGTLIKAMVVEKILQPRVKVENMLNIFSPNIIGKRFLDKVIFYEYRRIESILEGLAEFPISTLKILVLGMSKNLQRIF